MVTHVASLSYIILWKAIALFDPNFDSTVSHSNLCRRAAPGAIPQYSFSTGFPIMGCSCIWMRVQTGVCACMHLCDHLWLWLTPRWSKVWILLTAFAPSLHAISICFSQFAANYTISLWITTVTGSDYWAFIKLLRLRLV